MIRSWFYDSPLSELGINQVESLYHFSLKGTGLTTREKELIAIMRGDPDTPSSKLLSSSLRRALSTVAICFQERMKRIPTEKILVLPALQEISRNPDTLCITPPFTPVTASWIERDSKACAFQDVFSNRTDMSKHKGNKPINSNGLHRMKEFCRYVFSQPTEAFVVGGHSIWFRSFFKTFLPHDEFKVRGKQYLTDKKKVNAGSSIMQLIGVDIVQVPIPERKGLCAHPKEFVQMLGEVGMSLSLAL